MTASLIGFYILAGLLVAASLLVILQRNVVHSAMALVAALFLVAIFFFMLHAPLIGVLQVLVYAGAIMVLFLFVIMLLSPTAVEQRRFWSMGGAAAFFLAVILVAFIRAEPPTAEPVPLPEMFGSPEMVGRSLFTDFLLPFEIIAVLLLVAMIGALVLAKRGS
jgi:NADH-quinone oxidoreductase subunit J